MKEVSAFITASPPYLRGHILPHWQLGIHTFSDAEKPALSGKNSSSQTPVVVPVGAQSKSVIAGGRWRDRDHGRQQLDPISAISAMGVKAVMPAIQVQ